MATLFLEVLKLLKKRVRKISRETSIRLFIKSCSFKINEKYIYYTNTGKVLPFEIKIGLGRAKIRPKMSYEQNGILGLLFFRSREGVTSFPEL